MRPATTICREQTRPRAGGAGETLSAALRWPLEEGRGGYVGTAPPTAKENRPPPPSHVAAPANLTSSNHNLQVL